MTSCNYLQCRICLSVPQGESIQADLSTDKLLQFDVPIKTHSRSRSRNSLPSPQPFADMGLCQSSSSAAVSTSKNFVFDGCEAYLIESTFNASSQAFYPFETLEGSDNASIELSTIAEDNSTAARMLRLRASSERSKGAPNPCERRASSPPEDLRRSVDFDLLTERAHPYSECFEKESSWSCLSTSDRTGSGMEDNTTSCRSRLNPQNTIPH